MLALKGNYLNLVLSCLLWAVVPVRGLELSGNPATEAAIIAGIVVIGLCIGLIFVVLAYRRRRAHRDALMKSESNYAFSGEAYLYNVTVV
eukprot:Clim_evm9s3 gene=Clim_evmTU9s3